MQTPKNNMKVIDQENEQLDQDDGTSKMVARMGYNVGNWCPVHSDAPCSGDMNEDLEGLKWK